MRWGVHFTKTIKSLLILFDLEQRLQNKCEQKTVRKFMENYVKRQYLFGKR